MDSTAPAVPEETENPTGVNDDDSLAERYRVVRARTRALAAPLSAEDQVVQSMTDASPTKWHLAHTTWFFETFILRDHAPAYRPFDARFHYLFNSYYEAEGPRHPRAERGLLTRPTLEAVHAYRAHVDEGMDALLAGSGARLAEEGLARLVELGLNHEQQHQELLLMDIKHVLSRNPLRPAYAPPTGARAATAQPLRWSSFAGGIHAIGHDGRGFCFDNETPRHRVWLEDFRLASRPVNNAEYLAFIEDGGYREPRWWLADGWQAVQEHRRRAPLYWFEEDGRWREFTLHGRRRSIPRPRSCTSATTRPTPSPPGRASACRQRRNGKSPRPRSYARRTPMNSACIPSPHRRATVCNR
jgi:ergothioneine biosynthesis protein EgtB